MVKVCSNCRMAGVRIRRVERVLMEKEDTYTVITIDEEGVSETMHVSSKEITVRVLTLLAQVIADEILSFTVGKNALPWGGREWRFLSPLSLRGQSGS